MLFNSYPFLFVFLPLTFIGTFWIGAYSHKLAILWLGTASLVFYGFWDSPFVLLLLGSTVCNYYFGRWIDACGKTASGGNASDAYAGRILFVAISINLLVLGYFKYSNFFIGAFVEAFGNRFVPFDITLPLGISFFTFTQIGFLVDVSRGLTAEASLGRYLLFVTYFPHLIAGPLLHHKQIMPQLLKPDVFRFNAQNISVGITIFVLALAKKIFLADSLSEIVEPIFNSASQGKEPMLVEAWVGSLAYALQLYFDFSAYSEMAIGLSLIFNVRLPLNFNSPFKARNVIEFWQRWHMSLTKYIYEYLYTPITTKFMRAGLGKAPFVENIYTVILPTMITFLIIGLWHGANWTYLAFGALHGFYMIINYRWQALKKKQRWKPQGAMYTLLCCTLTYMAVVVALVFFRAESVGTALTMLKGMAGLNGLSLPLTVQPVFAWLPFNAFSNSIVFQGLMPNETLAMNPLTAVVLIFLGQAIVWGLPNMHQLMCRFETVTEDLNHTKSTQQRASLTATSSRFSWSLNSANAIMIGLLFVVLIIAMATNKPSTFLYYQF